MKRLFLPLFIVIVCSLCIFFSCSKQGEEEISAIADLEPGLRSEQEKEDFDLAILFPGNRSKVMWFRDYALRHFFPKLTATLINMHDSNIAITPMDKVEEALKTNGWDRARKVIFNKDEVFQLADQLGTRLILYAEVSDKEENVFVVNVTLYDAENKMALREEKIEIDFPDDRLDELFVDMYDLFEQASLESAELVLQRKGVVHTEFLSPIYSDEAAQACDKARETFLNLDDLNVIESFERYREILSKVPRNPDAWYGITELYLFLATTLDHRAPVEIYREYRLRAVVAGTITRLLESDTARGHTAYAMGFHGNYMYGKSLEVLKGIVEKDNAPSIARLLFYQLTCDIPQHRRLIRELDEKGKMDNFLWYMVAFYSEYNGLTELFGQASTLLKEQNEDQIFLYNWFTTNLLDKAALVKARYMKLFQIGYCLIDRLRYQVNVLAEAGRNDFLDRNIILFTKQMGVEVDTGAKLSPLQKWNTLLDACEKRFITTVQRPSDNEYWMTEDSKYYQMLQCYEKFMNVAKQTLKRESGLNRMLLSPLDGLELSEYRIIVSFMDYVHIIGWNVAAIESFERICNELKNYIEGYPTLVHEYVNVVRRWYAWKANEWLFQYDKVFWDYTPFHLIFLYNNCGHFEDQPAKLAQYAAKTVSYDPCNPFYIMQCVDKLMEGHKYELMYRWASTALNLCPYYLHCESLMMENEVFINNRPLPLNTIYALKDKYPESSAVEKKIARILYFNGYGEEAEKALRSLIQVNPEIMWAYYFLENIYKGRGDHEEYMKVCESKIQMAPSELSAIGYMADLAEYYIWLRDINKGEALATRIWNMDPSPGASMYMMGMVSLFQKNYEQLEFYVNLYINRYKKDYFLDNFVDHYFENGEDEKAKELLEGLGMKVPFGEGRVMGLVQYYMRRNLYLNADEILTSYDKTLSNASEPQLFRAWFYLKRGLFEQAYEMIESGMAWSDWAERYDFYVMKLEILLEEEHITEARKTLETMQVLYPYAIDILNHEAKVLLAEGELEKALAVSDKLMKINPAYPNYRITRARILLELGRQEEALDLMEKVKQTEPCVKGDFYYPYALILHANQRTEEAKKAFQKVIEWEGDGTILSKKAQKELRSLK